MRIVNSGGSWNTLRKLLTETQVTVTFLTDLEPDTCMESLAVENKKNVDNVVLSVSIAHTELRISLSLLLPHFRFVEPFLFCRLVLFVFDK